MGVGKGWGGIVVGGVGVGDGDGDGRLGRAKSHGGGAIYGSECSAETIGTISTTTAGMDMG